MEPAGEAAARLRRGHPSTSSMKTTSPNKPPVCGPRRLRLSPGTRKRVAAPLRPARPSAATCGPASSTASTGHQRRPARGPYVRRTSIGPRSSPAASEEDRARTWPGAARANAQTPSRVLVRIRMTSRSNTAAPTPISRSERSSTPARGRIGTGAPTRSACISRSWPPHRRRHATARPPAARGCTLFR